MCPNFPRMCLLILLGGSSVSATAQTELSGNTPFGSNLDRMLPGRETTDNDLSAYDIDIRTAYQHFANGEFGEGYRFLNHAMKKDANRPEAYLGFAMAARAQKQFATAERALRKALEVAPEDARVREELARLLLLKQAPTDALAEIDYAIAIDGGENWRTLKVRAETLIALDRLEESAEVYPTIIDLIEARISSVRKSINVEEAKGEIVEMADDIEVIRLPNGVTQEIEVTRVDTVPKEAPAEWYRLLDKLREDLAEAKARLAEIRTAIASS